MGRLAFTATIALCIAIASGSTTVGQSEGPPPNFKMAFIGDQGLGPDAQAVLNLIKAEGAQAVLHSGDFEYHDDPAAWEAQIDAVLGADYPYFASIGNHDVQKYFQQGGYQDRLEARLKRLRITWKGSLGVLSSLHYQGIFIVMTAPGIFLPWDPLRVHRNFIRSELAADSSTWRISSWHKNMRKMQVGGKFNETGWDVYEESRKGGAIIATGHEHSYSRTHLLSNARTQTVASTDKTLVLARDNPATLEDEGRSFVFVSGLGGRSVRDQQRCLPTTPPYGCNGEWASLYTSNQGARSGALFATFNYQGDPTLAHFYFKDVAGNVPDQFFVRSAAAQAQHRAQAVSAGGRTTRSSSSARATVALTLGSVPAAIARAEAHRWKEPPLRTWTSPM